MRFLLDTNICIYIIKRQLRSQLERQGIVIGSMDMLIASQAISLGLILITNNVREFSRIPDLVIENWIW